MRTKLLLSLVVASAAIACGTSAPADGTGASSAAQMSDIQSMTRLSDGRYDVLCLDGHHETVTSDDLLANHVCGAATTGVRIFGSSDSCSGSPVAVVGDHTNCSTLGTSSAWSVSINGQCVDIPDTTVESACTSFKGAATAKVLIYQSSDSCSGAVAAYVGPNVDCSTLSSSTSAWSVSIDGHCSDIADTNVQAACTKFKGAADAKVLVFGSSDSCSGQATAYLGSSSDCSTLSSSDAAWSVSINGQCTDIADTNVQAACTKFKSAGDAHVTIYGGSDSCSGQVAAFVGGSTDCSTLSNSDAAWSVKIDGTCSDIPDTNIRDACNRYKGE